MQSCCMGSSCMQQSRCASKQTQNPHRQSNRGRQVSQQASKQSGVRNSIGQWRQSEQGCVAVPEVSDVQLIDRDVSPWGGRRGPVCPPPLRHGHVILHRHHLYQAASTAALLVLICSKLALVGPMPSPQKQHENHFPASEMLGTTNGRFGVPKSVY